MCTRVVVQDLVVDLVGEDDQRVLAGDLGDALEHLARVDRAGRVVRVDDDDRLGARRDLRARCRRGRAASRAARRRGSARACRREAASRRPERVVRRRDEHLVARRRAAPAWPSR